jgi:hypothetical protein
MHVIWRRYARSGYAPPWYYAAFAIGFVALAGWAVIASDWLVAACASAAALASMAATRFIPRLRAAKLASERRMMEAPHE